MSNSSILAFDLRNATIENLELWFLTNNYEMNDVSELTKSNLRVLLTSPLKKVYFFENAHIGSVMFKKFGFNSAVEDDLIRDIIPIKLNEIEMYRADIIDWIRNPKKTKADLAMGLRNYQEYREPTEEEIEGNFYYRASLPHRVSSIDVKELGFTLQDDTFTSNEKWLNSFVSKIEEHHTINDLSSVKLNNIYIIDKYIMCYSFCVDNNPKQFIFWSKHFKEKLQKIKPITFDNERRTIKQS